MSMVSAKAGKIAAAVVGVVLVFGVLAGVGVAGKRPFVVVGEGKIGRSEWGAWIEGSPNHRAASSPVCLSVALTGVGRGGSKSSESFECGVVRSTAPTIQAVSGGGGNRAGKRTAIVALFSAATDHIFVNVGQKGSGARPIRHIGRAAAARLGVEQIGYWS